MCSAPHSPKTKICPPPDRLIAAALPTSARLSIRPPRQRAYLVLICVHFEADARSVSTPVSAGAAPLFSALASLALHLR